MTKLKSLILSLLFGSIFLMLPSAPVIADGDYYNIGTATSTNGSFDAVSWSTGYPITVDQYGKYIVPV